MLCLNMTGNVMKHNEVTIDELERWVLLPRQLRALIDATEAGGLTRQPSQGG
jgi:hypothetical protein